MNSVRQATDVILRILDPLSLAHKQKNGLGSPTYIASGGPLTTLLQDLVGGTGGRLYGPISALGS